MNLFLSLFQSTKLNESDHDAMKQNEHKENKKEDGSKNCEEQQEFYNIVRRVQSHSHSSRCGGLTDEKKCAFGYPRPASESTHFEETTRKNGKKSLKLIMKRGERDRNINPYVPQLLMLTGSNMDCQFIPNLPDNSDAYAITNYIIGLITYVSKTDDAKSLQQIRDAIVAAMKANPQIVDRKKQYWNGVMKALCERVVGLPETFFLLSGLPLVLSSFPSVFLPTSLPDSDNRSRQLLTFRKMRHLREMDPTSHEYYARDFIETYRIRPLAQELTTYYDFARSWAVATPAQV
jgi:ATP-dependent DNA helicase PIF1